MSLTKFYTVELNDHEVSIDMYSGSADTSEVTGYFDDRGVTLEGELTAELDIRADVNIDLAAFELNLADIEELCLINNIDISPDISDVDITTLTQELASREDFNLGGFVNLVHRIMIDRVVLANSDVPF